MTGRRSHGRLSALNGVVHQGRTNAIVKDLEKATLFSSVEFNPVGADGIRSLYLQARNAIQRDFDFVNKAVVPPIDNVKEAYIGILPIP